jgi:hypothetical protein
LGFSRVSDRLKTRAGFNFLAPFNPIGWEDSAMAQRRRIKHNATFEERLAEEAIRFKEAAEKQPVGSLARELLLRRARQAETASHINNWLRSPGLRPPEALENLVSDQKK